ncbi:putative restriction endonuclease [Brucella pseudogrignonensis]|uniref:Restriction endonuclease n=1 Tax=Brucella pseudogrignonensis TaxID=419475 RepID=A0ABU1M3X2_9HYPH|nr:putative restriction endonuclease [Brucella pseudogrignonensis]
MTIYKYEDLPNLTRRSIQIYTILVVAAHNRQILTYKIVANLIGYRGAGVLDRQLGLLLHWCEHNNLPPLTSIVVNTKTGIPGEGFQLEDMNSAREKVFAFKWYQIVAPTEDDLNEYLPLVSRG